MKLVVGLGNPGKKYKETRHNVGFDLVERLAERWGAESPRQKFDGFVREGMIGQQRTLLLMPATYMNLSGRSVRQAVDFYKIPLTELLVVCDDFNLPLGVLRMRGSGSDGGQKGLADIIQQLGSDQFARLRLGIGPVPDRWNPADFVLSTFPHGQRDEVNEQIARACDAVESWLAEGVERTMNQFNGSVSDMK